MPNIEITATSNVRPGVEGLKEVQRELGNTAIAAQRTDSSLSKLGTGLTGVSKVTGTASSALSGFGATLLSGGIALGVSAAIAGLITLGSALLEISAAQKRYNDVLDGAKSAYIKATLEVEKMKDAFEKARTGVISKESALKLYNNTIGKTIGQTNDLDIAERNFIANAENYIKFTLYKAAAQVALSKAAEAAFNAEAARTKTASRGFLEGYVSQDELKRRRVAAAIKEQASFQAIYNNLIAKANEFGFTGIDQAEKEVKTQEKKVRVLRTISDVLSDLDKKLNLISDKRDLIGTEKAKASISALEGALDELLNKFNLSKKNPIVLDLAFRINQGNLGISSNNFLQREIEKIKLQTEAKPIEVKPKIVVKPLVSLESSNFTEEMSRQLMEAIYTLTQSMSSTITSGINSIFESVANAATGKGGIGDIFEGLAKVLGSGIKQFGQQILQFALLAKLAKLAAKNPITGVAAGIALIALGTAIEAAASKNAFATGVTNFGGGTALVGERGPELVQLPAGSNVRTNGQLNAMGGSQVFIPDLVIRGNDLVVVFNRTTAQNSRNGF